MSDNCSKNETSKINYQNRCILPVLLFLFLLISTPAQPQSGHASKRDAANIKATELLVIIDNTPTAYNIAIKAAIEKYWKFSPFRFVTESEKHNFCVDGYTIMDKQRIDNYSSLMYYIAIVFPGRNGCNWNTSDMKAYSYASFNPDKIKGETIRSVQFIQNYLQLVIQKGGGANGLKVTCDLCNDDMKTVKDKLLLINNADLEKGFDDAAKIARYYKYAFKLAGREDICREMEEQNSNVAYAMYFIDDKKYVYRLVVQAKDSKIIYCERDLTDQRLLFGKVNFKELSR